MQQLQECLAQGLCGSLAVPASKVLGPTGDILIAPSANNLEEVEAPDLAPATGDSQNQLQGMYLPPYVEHLMECA